MSAPKTNLLDVLARASANTSASMPETPLNSAPKAGSSKFKPIKNSESANTRKLPGGSSLPSFTTPGFGKAKPDHLATSLPVSKQAVVYVSDSTPSSPRGSGIKRTSSDPAFTSDSSPQPPKRSKKSDVGDKENLPQTQKKLSKAKAKTAPLNRISIPMNIDDDKPWQKTGRSVEPNPFACLDRDYPLPITEKKERNAECPPGSYDLPQKSSDELTTCLLHCHKLKNTIMEDIVEYHRGADKDKDIVVLEAIKDLLDNRIANIQSIEKGQSCARNTSSTKEPSNSSTNKDPTGLSSTLERTDLPYGAPSASGLSDFVRNHIPPQGAPSVTYPAPPFETTLLTNVINIDDSGDASDDEYWVQMQDVTMEDMPEVVSTARVDDLPSSSSSTLLSPSPTPPRAELTSTPFYSELKGQLQKVFLLENFRKNQLEATTAAMQGHDVFVLMPTGGGKSLCYQLPAVCTSGQRKGVTVVVTPLLALMNDQVNQLRNRFKLNALAWNSENSVDENVLSSGQVPMLYITPEKLQESNYVKTIFSRLYRKNFLARFVIDEAHCISTWGQDFRDAYTTLGSLREQYPEVPIMALTATANKTTVKDIIAQLKLRNVAMFTQSFNRPNLTYIIKDKMKNYINDMVDMLKTKYAGRSGVIYCRARQKCENLAETLQKNGIRAAYYHAGLQSIQRETTANDWQENRISIVVATVAFGMGIDKADVRFVLHHDLPKSLSGYYQETGRAGRDGKPADCILYSSYKDYNSLLKMIQDDKDTTSEAKQRQEAALREVYNYVRNQSGCRRVQLLQHFDEKFDKKHCKNTCDTCLDIRDTVSEDVTDLTKGTIRLLRAARERNTQVTLTLLLNGLRGSAAQDVKRKGLDNMPGYSVAKDVPTELVDLTLKHLMFIGVVSTLTVKNANTLFHNEYIQIGPEANGFLGKKERLFLDWRPKAPSKTTKTRKTAAAAEHPNSAANTRKGKGKQKEIAEDPIELYDESSLDFSDGEGAAKLIPQRPKRGAAGPSRTLNIGAAPMAASISARRERDVVATGMKVVTVSENDLRVGAADDGGSDPVELYQKMCMLRAQIMTKERLAEPEDVYANAVLETLSAICPSDYHSFKQNVVDVMIDVVGSQNAAVAFSDDRWNKFGREFFTLCVEHKTAPLRRAESAKKKIAELHSTYGYQGAITPTVSMTTPASSNTSTVTRKSNFKSVC